MKKYRKDFDDPLQYHAKPKDLSKNSLSNPAEFINQQPSLNSAIFTSSTFSTYNLDSRLVSVLEKNDTDGGLSLTRTTSVQSAVIPTLLKRSHNIFIKSQTGSGKTLSYLIPVIQDLITLCPPSTRGDGTRALVIAPTRELCQQISDIVTKLTRGCVWIIGGCISGGEKRKSEKARLRKGITLLVGTPGRLLDHLKATESFNLTKLRWIILDEADRLLDMGFEQTLLEILSIIRGSSLPGLKSSKENNNNEKSGGTGKLSNMTTKWAKQNAVAAKICENCDDLIYALASATLTQSLVQVAHPILSAMKVVQHDSEVGTKQHAGTASFVLIDADSRTSIPVNRESDLLLSARTAAAVRGVVSFFDPSDTDNLATTATASSSASSLQKGEVMQTPQQLSQYHMMMTCKLRLAALLSFLKMHTHQKVVVFFSTCDSVDFHALLFRETDWPLELDAPMQTFDGEDAQSGSQDQVGMDEFIAKETSAARRGALPNSSAYLNPLEPKFHGIFGKDCPIFRLHGSVPHKVRQTVYRDFCAAPQGFLLCTDVAARGLDLPKVDWILQYDPPCETADYVHRVGRTARIGEQGAALLFLLPAEAAYLALLASHGLKTEALSLQSLILDAATKYIPGSSKFKNQDEMGAVILQRRLERTVAMNKPLTAAAVQAFRSFIRAYATHSSDTKGIFRVEALHLGHAAKSFALKDKPTALRGGQDIIGQIFNGVFAGSNSSQTSTATAAEDKESKKRSRDEKFSLSSRSSGNGRNKKLKKTEPFASALSPSRAIAASSALKKGKDRQKLRKMGQGDRESGDKKAVGGQNAPLLVGKNFRKTNGYFRKKLRAQSNSEFSVG